MKRKTIDIISAITWTIFGFVLAYTSYSEGNTGIAVLGAIIGTAWFTILIASLVKKKNITMRKIVITGCLSFLLLGCNSTQKITETSNTTTSTKEVSKKTVSQKATVKQGESVKITPKKPTVKMMLVGKESREALTLAPFNTWFERNYANYTVKDSLNPAIKKGLKGITITTFMGTWCGDSKRETPHILKILDAANFKDKKFELITVDRTKKNPKEFTEGNNIIRVPTFIFKKDGVEIGRIVERPVESLEADMLKILNGEPYKHAYEK